MTLFIVEEQTATVFYYGTVMVIMYSDDDFHVHQLEDAKHADELNRIMWERW